MNVLKIMSLGENKSKIIFYFLIFFFSKNSISQIQYPNEYLYHCKILNDFKFNSGDVILINMKCLKTQNNYELIWFSTTLSSSFFSIEDTSFQQREKRMERILFDSNSLSLNYFNKFEYENWIVNDLIYEEIKKLNLSFILDKYFPDGVFLDNSNIPYQVRNAVFKVLIENYIIITSDDTSGKYIIY